MAEKRRSGCLKKLLVVLLIILILAIALPLTLFWLAIGAYSPQPVDAYNPHDASTVANIITRLARSLVDKEGRVVETAVLILSKDEVQTLINSAIREANGGDSDSRVLVDYEVIWKEDGLLLKYSMPVSTGGIKVKSLSTGRQSDAINFRIEFSPVVDCGKLTVYPQRGSAGMIPLPRFALRKAANFLTARAMANDSVRTTLSAFTRIEPGEDGTLVLMFDPRNVNTVVRILRSAGEERDGFAIQGEDREDEEDREEEEEDWEEEEEDEEEEEWVEMEELEDVEEDSVEGTEDANADESIGEEPNAVDADGGDADAAVIQPVL